MRYQEFITESKLHGLTVMSLDRFVKNEAPEAKDEGIEEGDVIYNKFQTRQDQKGKTPYYKNPDIEIPQYDRKRGSAYHAGISQGQPEPFDSFEVQPAGKTSAHIIGITKDGRKVRISTATQQLADVLANAYNRGGFTDVPLQKVPLGRGESLEEAPGDFGLGARYRTASDDEMQQYAGRIKDKAKTKTDPYKMPYIHGSNIQIVDQGGQKYDLEALKKEITQRPGKILKQNEKMVHSDGTSSIFFNVGLPALKGLAVNENTGEFVVVDTCPGAGACQTFCYAMKGSYVMFKAVSMNLTRMLNFLLNDPEGFASRLGQEISDAEKKFGKKGTQVVVRWHDAGDFFSPEYLDMAYKVARSHPDVQFYAYTKMASVAQADRPANFKMNFSQGAKPGEERKIDFVKTKHSKVVPKNQFFDLIARKGNELIKDAKGRMQFASPEALEQFKQRMAATYKIDPRTILTYDQMMSVPEGDQQKWNVIVMPGDGDDSANRRDVLGTYLLFH